jgi:phosphoserine phosphatase RsbU/P
MAYLDALTGSALGKRYELDRLETILGRHPECHVVLDSGAVSRQHAKIIRDSNRYLLEDLKSRNGTFINGRLISEPTSLQDADVIRICDLERWFEHGGFDLR